MNELIAQFNHAFASRTNNVSDKIVLEPPNPSKMIANRDMSIDIRNTVIEQEMKDVANEESGFISDDDNDDVVLAIRHSEVTVATGPSLIILASHVARTSHFQLKSLNQMLLMEIFQVKVHRTTVTAILLKMKNLYRVGSDIKKARS